MGTSNHESDDGFVVLPYLAFALFVATVLTACVTLLAVLGNDGVTFVSGLALTAFLGTIFGETLVVMTPRSGTFRS